MNYDSYIHLPHRNVKRNFLFFPFFFSLFIDFVDEMH